MYFLYKYKRQAWKRQLSMKLAHWMNKLHMFDHLEFCMYELYEELWIGLNENLGFK